MSQGSTASFGSGTGWAILLAVSIVVLTGVDVFESPHATYPNRKLQIFSNSTGIFISEAIDEFFRSIFGENSPVYDILAASGIVVGVVYTFFGAKLEKTTAFLAGVLIGCIGAALILETTGAQNSISNGIYVTLFFGAGILVGVLSFCLASFRKLIFGLALAILFMSFIIYLGFGEAVGNNYALLAITAVAGLIFVYLGFKAAELIMVILSTLIGGVLVILGISHFTQSTISLYTLSSDPSAVLACNDSSCLIPLIIGVVLTLLGLLYQTRRYRKAKRKEKNAEESQRLLEEMRDYREKMEQRLADIDKKHQNEMLELQAEQESRHSQTIQSLQQQVRIQQEEHERALTMVERKLSAQEKQLLEEKRKAQQTQQAMLDEIERRQEEESEKLRRTLEREFRDKEQQLASQMEQEAILRQLEEEKVELEKQLEEEKQNKGKTEEELRLEQEREREERIREKENREIEAIHHATVVSLQNEVEENKQRIKEYEEEIKEANRLAKRIRAPTQIEVEEEDDDAHPAIAEVRERAIEFAKLKQLANKAKQEQKQALKLVKKALKDVEGLSKEIQKEKRKTASKPKTDEEIDEQQMKMDELSARMERARSLLTKYEEYSNQYTTLIQDLVQATEDFKKAEKRLEAYDDYDLRLNVREGIAIEGEIEEENGEIVRAEDILEGTIVRQPRGPNGEVRRLHDNQIDFEFLLNEFTRYINRRFRISPRRK